MSESNNQSPPTYTPEQVAAWLERATVGSGPESTMVRHELARAIRSGALEAPCVAVARYYNFAPTLAEAAALATRDTIPRARVVEAMRGVAVTWQWSGTATECARDIAAALNIPWSEVEP